MKKSFALLLCLHLLVGLCGTAFAEVKPQGLPEVCFTSFASENGLEGNLYYLVGKVIRVEDFESGGKQYHTIVIQTEYGYADIMDIYAFSQEYYPEELKDIGHESDYSFPGTDEFAKAIVVYSGYSDKVQMPLFFYWTPEIMEEIYEPEESQEQSRTPTMGESNALRSAKNYLSLMAFSYKGIIEQLEYEGYTHTEAVYAADNCGADWFEQAVNSAKRYLDIMSFSRSGLIEQLEFEGFTHEQAVYGAERNGY